MNCMEFMLAANGLAALVDHPVEVRSRSNSRAGLIGLPVPPLLNPITVTASQSSSRHITSRSRATRLSKRCNLSAAFLVLKNKNLGRTSERIRLALSAAGIRHMNAKRRASERVEDQGPASVELYMPPPMDDGPRPSSVNSMDLALPPMLVPDAALPSGTPARSKSLDLPLPPMIGEVSLSPAGVPSMRRSLSLHLDPLPPLRGRFTEVSPPLAPETHIPVPSAPETVHIAVFPSAPSTYPRAVAPVAMHKLPSPPILMTRISSPSMQSRNLQTGNICPKYHKNDFYPYWCSHRYPKRAWLQLSKESYVAERVSWTQWSATGLEKEGGMTMGSGYGGDEEDEDGLEYEGHTYRSRGLYASMIASSSALPSLSSSRTSFSVSANESVVLDAAQSTGPSTEEHDPWAYFMKGFEHEAEESDSDLWATDSE